MSSRRASTVLKLFLALLFVCAQQQAVLHMLGHSLERIEQKKDAGGVDERFCAKCLAIAHLDHAVGSATFDVPPIVFVPPYSATTRYESARLSRIRSYHTRGPPSFA